MKKIVMLSALAAAVAVGTPANAATTTAGGIGVLFNTAGDPSATFDTAATPAQPYGPSGPAFGPFLEANGSSFSGSAMIMFNPGQDSLGLYAEPFHDQSNYLTVQPAGGSETIQLTGGLYSRFGLYWGSMDTYNSIEFYRNGALVDTVLGQQAANSVPSIANGGQQDDLTNRYIEITNIANGGLFDTVVLLSTARSFEVDNLSWGCGPEGTACAPPDATPLPAALPLFVSGLGGFGFLSFWRKKRQALKMAAA